MTIASQIIKHVYEGDAAQTQWPVHFPFFAPEEVRAVIAAENGSDKVLVYGVDYTVTSNATHSGGIVETTNALATGTILTLYLDLAFTQELDLRNNGILDAEQLESSLDRLTLMCQNLRERLSRAWVAPLSGNISGEDMLLETRELARSLASSKNATQHYAQTATEAASRAERAAADSVLPKPQLKDIGKFIQIQEDLHYAAVNAPSQQTAAQAPMLTACQTRDVAQQSPSPSCWTHEGLTLSLNTQEEDYVISWPTGASSRISGSTLSVTLPNCTEATRLYIRLDTNPTRNLSWTDIPCEYSSRRRGWAYPAALRTHTPSFGIASSNKQDVAGYPCELLFANSYPADKLWNFVGMESAAYATVRYTLHKQRRLCGVRIIYPEYSKSATTGAVYLSQFVYGTGVTPDTSYPVTPDFIATATEELDFGAEGLHCNSFECTFNSRDTAKALSIARIQPMYSDDWFSTVTNTMYDSNDVEVQRIYLASVLVQGETILELSPVLPGKQTTIMLPEELGLSEQRIIQNPFGTGHPIEAKLEFFIPFVGWVAPEYEVYQESLSATGAAGGRALPLHGDILCTTGSTTLYSSKHSLFGLPKGSDKNSNSLRARVQVQRIL